MSLVFGQPTPILRIFDVAKAREFYVESLEFMVSWEHRFADGLPLYLEINRSGCTIHLTEHHGDCTPVSALRIAVSDIALFHKELSDKAYAFMRPGYDPVEKEVCLIDPFGNRLIFFEENT